MAKHTTSFHTLLGLIGDPSALLLAWAFELNWPQVFKYSVRFVLLSYRPFEHFDLAYTD